MFQGKVIDCKPNQSIRDALLEAETTPHNGEARWFNCKGLGSCGTCAIFVVGKVSKLTRRESVRLRMPPHHISSGRRLACQTIPLEDVSIIKSAGFWGQHFEPQGET